MPPLTDQEINRRRRKRVIELLKQGLSVRQVHERTGMVQRQIHRIRKKLLEEKANA
jgi:uncharacterized protein YerC